MIWSKKLTVVALCCVAIYVGLDAWSRFQPPEEAPHTAQLLAEIRKTREKEQVARLVADSLRAIANGSGEKTDENPDGAFTIVLDAHLPAPSVTPSGEKDTTTFVTAIRESDKRPFLVPLFLVRGYRDEHALRLYDEDVRLPLAETARSQAWDLAQDYRGQRDASRRETRFWKAATVGTGVLALAVLLLK